MSAIEEKRAKAKLFAYIAKRHPSIVRIEVDYDGWGDEGWIDDVKYFDATIKKGKGRLPRGPGQRRDTVPTGKDKADKDNELWELVDEVLSHVCPGGTGPGGYGVVLIHTATQKVEVRDTRRTDEEFEEMLNQEIEEEED